MKTRFESFQTAVLYAVVVGTSVCLTVRARDTEAARAATFSDANWISMGAFRAQTAKFAQQ